MNTLGVFAKWPEPGRVKTRLELEPSRAMQIAEAFLRDTLDRCTLLANVRKVVVFAPAERQPQFQAILPQDWVLEPQAQGDLGARLEAFFTHRLLGDNRVVALGTDSPTLPLEYVTQAFDLLGESDVVVGPACDGGYYLIGIRGTLPPLFTGIEWSSSRVLEQTIAALADPHWRVRLLPPWYDVDTPADWQLLTGHLAALRRAGLDPLAPRTAGLVQSRFEREGVNRRPG